MVGGNTNIEKFYKAIEIIKSGTTCAVHGIIINEETFNTIEWDIDGTFTTENPYTELTWTKVKTEMDKL